MPEDTRHRPRAATCEDWDDVKQTTLPGSRRMAKVVSTKKSHPELRTNSDIDAISHEHKSREEKQRHALVRVESTTRTKLADLRTNIPIAERERQPYQISGTRPKADGNRSPTKKDTHPSPQVAHAKPYIHKPGICRVCDAYGRHYEPEELHKLSTASAPVLGAIRNENIIPDPRLMTPSYSVQPINMYQSLQSPVAYVPNMVSYAPPVLAPHPYTPVQPPSMLYAPMAYHTPITPLTPSYSYFDTTAVYCDPSLPLRMTEPKAVKTSRRQSQYGEPVIQQGRPRRRSDSPEKVHRSSHEAARPKTSQVDVDRVAMPPPPKPNYVQPDITVGQRPSLKKATTYNPEPISTRLVTGTNEDGRRQLLPAPQAQDPPRSPTRLPPTSYRGPAPNEQKDRPLPARKSVSYSDGTTTTKVSSSQPKGLVRRTTIATTPLERKEADIEAYQRRRSEMTTDELAAEALRGLNPQNSSSRSETGSNYSHKSQYSSSRDSSGRERSQTSAARTSITIDGGIKVDIPADYTNSNGRPLSINFGNGLTLSMNSKDSEDGRREQKRIERPPSVASYSSRHSLQGGQSSSKDNDVDRSRQVSRKPSEDYVANTKHSRRPSRASVSRSSFDHNH